MKRSVGIAIGAAMAYAAVPVIMRMRNGCPPFGAKTVTLANGAQVQACKPLTLKDVLLWPFGFLAGKV